MTLLSTLERACGMLVVSASVANNLDANIYAGTGDTKMELPLVVISGEAAQEIIKDSGFFRCNLLVQVQERVVDTDLTSSLAQSTFDAFVGESIKTKLAAFSTSSLHVADIGINDLRKAIGTDDKSRIQEMNLEIISALLQ